MGAYGDALLRQAEGGERAKILSSPPLWLGKPHSEQQGVDTREVNWKKRQDKNGRLSGFIKPAARARGQVITGSTKRPQDKTSS